MKDTLKRSIIKTIVFKLITTSVTAMFLGWKGAILLHVVMTIIYLVHERLWNLVKWGKIAKSNEVLHNEQDGYVQTEQLVQQPV